MGVESFKFESDKKLSLNYLVYLPKGYNSSDKWPLILSLHGSGERGSDIVNVKK